MSTGRKNSTARHMNKPVVPKTVGLSFFSSSLKIAITDNFFANIIIFSLCIDFFVSQFGARAGLGAVLDSSWTSGVEAPDGGTCIPVMLESVMSIWRLSANVVSEKFHFISMFYC
jgi:hypothetical protein